MAFPPECLRTVPETFENSVSESLAARTKSLAKIKGVFYVYVCLLLVEWERTCGNWLLVC